MRCGKRRMHKLNNIFTIGETEIREAIAAKYGTKAQKIELVLHMIGSEDKTLTAEIKCSKSQYWTWLGEAIDKANKNRSKYNGYNETETSS